MWRDLIFLCLDLIYTTSQIDQGHVHAFPAFPNLASTSIEFGRRWPRCVFPFSFRISFTS